MKAESKSAPRKDPIGKDRGKPTGVRPGRPTKRQIEERNKLLLEKALDLFAEKGFDSTTIQEITEAVGMAKRTVTSHYGNKVALFKAALKRAIDEWVVPEKRLRAAVSDAPEATLFATGRILADSYLEPANLRLARITNSASHSMPEISIYMYEQFTKPLASRLADIFRNNIAAGEDFPDAEQYALTFLTLMGTPARLIAWGVDLSKAEIDVYIEHSVRVFLYGLMDRGVSQSQD